MDLYGKDKESRLREFDEYLTEPRKRALARLFGKLPSARVHPCSISVMQEVYRPDGDEMFAAMNEIVEAGKALTAA